MVAAVVRAPAKGTHGKSGQATDTTKEISARHVIIPVSYVSYTSTGRARPTSRVHIVREEETSTPWLGDDGYAPHIHPNPPAKDVQATNQPIDRPIQSEVDKKKK